MPLRNQHNKTFEKYFYILRISQVFMTFYLSESANWSFLYSDSVFKLLVWK